jgi:WD40 repeat protein
MKSSHLQPLNPFPGLRPFRSDEHHLFFGREDQTAALLQLLRTNRFLAVVGTSGSGKSSLVRAGMIAELYGGTMTQAGSTWEVMILRPGGSPIENLARAMVEADLYDVEDASSLPRLRATLSRSRYGLVEAMKQSEVIEPGTNLLVVVDQFEELFRFRQSGIESEETATAFVNLLLTATQQSECPIYVAITMRSDYLGDCSEIPGLAEAVNDGEYLIPRLMRDQKRDAIEKPIGVGGAKISPLLVQRLLNDVGDDPDQLPVLQHALMRMWEVWSDGSDHNRPLSLSDFEATGGLASALSNHADEIYDALPTDAHRAACEKIFKTLTEKGEDNRGIRRPTRLSQLQAIAGADLDCVTTVLDAFRQSGVTFLMPGMDVELNERTVIDLSHESLMRGWQRLRSWVEEEAQSARIFRRVLDTARLWNDGKAGLFRDPDLQIALSWREEEQPNADWAEQYGGDFETAIGFLDASHAEVESERQAKELARQRELQQAQRLAETERQRATDQARAAVRLRWMVRGLGLVAMVAIMATVFAWLARQEARRNADTALQAQQDTERALKEAEAAETLAKVNEAEAERQKAAALLAEQRSREYRYATDIELAARMVNDKTANAAQLSDRLADFDPTMNKSLVATDDMRGFEWYYLKKLVDSRSSVFSGFNKPVIAAAMTSEGVLITLDDEAQVRRFDAGTKQERGAPTDLKKGRNIVAKTLSPDGQRVAIAVGNEVQIFDAVSGEQIGRSIPTQVRGGLIFSPDSRMLITMDTSIGWWDAATCKPIAVQDFQLTTFGNLLQPLSTSADGLTLAVGGQGTYRSAFSVFKLDPRTREITRLLDKTGGQGTKRAMAISPDGETVAISLYFQGGIYVYETATGKLLQSLPSAHSSAISAIAFAEDSTQMVTASLDGTIKLWNDYHKLDPDEANTFIGHAEEVNLLTILPGDKQLLSASSDKTVRVWNLGQSKTELHKKLAGAMGSPRASFSADGTLIATPGGLTGSTAGNRLRIWDATTGQPAMEFPEGSRTDLSADSVAFSPDGRLLAAGFGGIQDVSYIELWDIERRERIAVLPGSTAIPGFTTDENSGSIPGLAFSPDGKHLVAAFGSMNLMSRGDTGNFPLLVYDVATRQVVRRLEGHRNFCMAVAFSRDGSRMASASQDGTARIWDTATWRELQVLDNPDTASEAGQRRVYDVAFSPNGALLAMASAEGNVILFDVASGDVLQKLRGHSNEVQGVAFAPDGLTLASGSRDGTIRLWNTATWRELLRLEPEKGFTPYSISFSPSGDRLLASAYGTGGTLLWSIPRNGSTSGTTSDELAKLLDSNIDFRHRIRLLSDDLQLHEPLAILAQREPNRAEVNASLAATRAHWHAERSEWGQAVEQFDRLKLLSPEAPQDWLRTPGLLRLATALFHEGRSADAASLLIGGEARRAEDGNGTRSDSFGFVYDPSAKPAKLTQVFRGSPAWNGGLRVGDTLLKINDVAMTSENRAKYQDAMQNPVEGKLSITFQHSGNHLPETAEIMKASYIQDDLTVELIENLLAAIDKKLAEPANDPVCWSCGPNSLVSRRIMSDRSPITPPRWPHFQIDRKTKPPPT